MIGKVEGFMSSCVHPVPFHKPEGVPPVRYIRPDAPQGTVPEIKGKSYESLIPDTCNVEEVARLFLEHYLTEITIPDKEYYHEPFNRGFFTAVPPRITLDIGSYLCALPKYREALPLLRMMTGSQKGLEIDKAWADHLLKGIGPDGLWYVTRVGRPWDGYIGSGLTDKGYWWQMPEDCEFYAGLALGNGRLLGSLALYYDITGDELWNKTAKGVVDRLNELAVKVDGIAFFPKFVWMPHEKLSPEERQKAVADMKNQTVGETDKNTALWQTWIITGLAQYYRVSKYEPARELGYALIKYLRDTRYVEEWTSHFHCITLGIHAMLEWAMVTGDRELGEYARKAYDHARLGRTPEGKVMSAIPSIGFFVNSLVNSSETDGQEGCSIGDMAALSIKLAQFGMGDEYWEDADRYTRNFLTGSQRTRKDYAETIFRRLEENGRTKEVPLSHTDLADHLAERLVGTFSCAAMPNDLFALPYFDSCCQGNIVRALYYVWENILRYDAGKKKLTINLLLNRTSPWADLDSCIPYTGHVEVKVKQPCSSVRIRMNDWIEKDKVRCSINDKDQKFTWDGNYLVLGAAQPNQTIALDFPIEERRERLDGFVGRIYEAVFKGNDCVDINPKGKYYPLFQRDHYRFNEPRFVKSKRFVCENPVEY
jgi:hypothetical protein